MAQKHINKLIEVWLLTGYLGAGKTTAMNHLLSSDVFSGKKIALIINEFGSISIDGQLIKPGEYIKYEINKGSIFCICTKTDLLQTFQKIRNLKMDTVLIEATGVSETSDIEQLLCEPFLQNDFQIRANICIVDCMNFIKTAAYLRAAVSQAQWADGLVINKTDKSSEKEISQTTEVIKELNPSAKILHTNFGKLEKDFLNSLRYNRHEKSLLTCPPAEIPTAHIATNNPVDKEYFYKTVGSLKEHILRLKGDVGFESGPSFMEVAGEELIESPFCGKFTTMTAFTVIGWKIEKQKLKDAFEKCIIKNMVAIGKKD